MSGRVELAALLALGAGELRQEVLVDALQRVPGPVDRGAQADVADEVDELAQALLVQTRAPVVLGQLGDQLSMPGLERVGDVLQEDEAQDDVLVLGRVHVVAERIGGLP